MPQVPRPPRITIAAIIAAIGSGLAFVLGLFALVGVPFYPFGAAGAPSRALLIASPVLLLAAGGWGLATARGLLGLKPWARTSVLIFSPLLVFLGAMGTFFLLTANIPVPPGITQEQFRVIRDAVSVVYFLFLVIGVWWMVQFSSPLVRAAFRGEGEALPPAPAPVRWQPGGAKAVRPRSISIIGFYLLAGAISAAVQILVGGSATVFGRTLAGPTGSIVYLAMFAMQAYLGVGLLQLQPLSRVLSICFFLLEFLNTVVFVALPGREERLAAMFRSGSGTLPPEISPSTAFLVLLLSAGVMTALPLWFLVTRKSAFVARQRPS